MSIELLLIVSQFVFVLLVGCVILLLINRRQRRTIDELKTLLMRVKEDLSGETLLNHLRAELDNTTAHCRQQTVAVQAELTPEDMAVALRAQALKAELALAELQQTEPRIPWRQQIEHYLVLAQTVIDMMQARVVQATRTLTEVHQEELAGKAEIIANLEHETTAQQQQLANLKPLRDCLAEATNPNLSREDLEFQLHKALLGLCENFADSENLRELVYLIHEAFYAANQATTESTGDSTTPAATAPSPHSEN